MDTDNQQVVLTYVDAFNRGDLDALRALFAPDAVIYGVLGSGGLDKAAPIWNDLIQCFNIHLQVDAMVTEGDTVAVRYVERGKSVKSFREGPVTGRTYQVIAMEWFEITDGLIQRRWGARDSASIFQQMRL